VSRRSPLLSLYLRGRRESSRRAPKGGAGKEPTYFFPSKERREEGGGSFPLAGKKGSLRLRKVPFLFEGGRGSFPYLLNKKG